MILRMSSSGTGQNTPRLGTVNRPRKLGSVRVVKAGEFEAREAARAAARVPAPRVPTVEEQVRRLRIPFSSERLVVDPRREFEQLFV